MNVAAGSLISQAIVKDPKTYQRDTPQTKVFNVQIHNSQHFQTVMGVAPTYITSGYSYLCTVRFPFFIICEEPTAVSEDFSMVKSSTQINSTSGTRLGTHRVYSYQSAFFRAVKYT